MAGELFKSTGDNGSMNIDQHLINLNVLAQKSTPKVIYKDVAQYCNDNGIDRDCFRIVLNDRDSSYKIVMLTNKGNVCSIIESACEDVVVKEIWFSRDDFIKAVKKELSDHKFDDFEIEVIRKYWRM